MVNFKIDSVWLSLAIGWEQKEWNTEVKPKCICIYLFIIMSAAQIDGLQTYIADMTWNRIATNTSLFQNESVVRTGFIYLLSRIIKILENPLTNACAC